MNRCGANLRMFVPLRVLTLRTSLYTYSQVLVNMYCIIDSFVFARTLCEIPCVCALAGADTLKLFGYMQKLTIFYICFIIDAIVYEPMFCKLTYAFALASVYTLARFVYIIFFRSVHIFYHRCVCIWTDVVQTYVCLCPLRVLTLRTLLYTYISRVLVYMYCIIDSFVSEPLLCEIPYVCALAGADTLKLFGYMQKLTSIHMLYHRCDCIWTNVLQTHICLCPWECSQLEPLCIHP